jgi:hypothetical protein
MKRVKRVALSVLLGCAAAAWLYARDGAWRRAQAAWRAHDPAAWRDWQALDAHGSDGRRAHARLSAADAEYRRGIALLAANQPGAREALRTAAATAPMDPALYLPLARACRDRGLLERAADLYRKFLAAAPAAAAADEARAELAALGDDVAPLLDEVAPATRMDPAPLVAAMLVALAGAAALVVLVARRRHRGRTLVELAALHPELQPAIAFLVGCLRHELLKQRIVATGEAVQALARGDAQPGEREFLLARLYGGEPLTLAWAGHLSAFLRALGPHFDPVRNDRTFRDADRAIAAVSRLSAAVNRKEAAGDAWRRLADAHARLVAFDGSLATLTAQLTHTRLDAALVREVIDAVRGELGLGAALDEAAVGAVADGVAVEMYRFDLVLVLKNVVRNAMTAAAAGPAPRRVLVDVAVALEATGEEIVRVRVRDTSPGLPASPAALSTRGLGLVGTVLDRYDGSLAVEPAGDGYAKAVVVRLFRALGPAAEAA